MPGVPPRTAVDHPCDQCGVVFRLYQFKIKRAKPGARFFCSRRCQLASYHGAGNPKWRGGRWIGAGGYRFLSLADGTYVQEHRHVMAQALGRPLTPAEIVHHINGDKLDNRLENLEVLASHTDHMLRHADRQPDACAMCGTLVMRTVTHRKRWARAFCSRTCAALYASEANAAAARTRHPS